MMMKSKATNSQNKLMKIITMPIKALAKARDFYVRSMNNYADKVCYGASGWGGTSYGDPLPRSFSTNSIRSAGNDEDMRELIRAASTTQLGTRIDLNSVLSNSSNSSSNNYLKQQRDRDQHHQVQGKLVRGVPRSASVGMAKIEEDKPCDHFGDIDDILVGKKSNISGKTNVKDKFRLFPRSRSYAVGGGAKRTPPVF